MENESHVSFQLISGREIKLLIVTRMIHPESFSFRLSQERSPVETVLVFSFSFCELCCQTDLSALNAPTPAFIIRVENVI